MALDDETTGKVRDRIRRYTADLAAIRADKGLTDRGKRDRIAAAHKQATADVQALTGPAEAKAKADTAALHRRLVGLRGSDPSSVISYRDGVDRASNAKTPGELAALLGRAVTAGDAELQRACLAVGLERYSPLSPAWGDTIDRYVEANPGQGDAVQEYLDATAPRSATATLAEKLATSVPTPAELRHGAPEPSDALPDNPMADVGGNSFR